MKVPKCKECKHSIWNTGCEFCSKDCPEGELFEPIEKTYTLLELEEGEKYSCDESSGATIYIREGDCLKAKRDGKFESWLIVKSIYCYKTFRKSKKKLTFKNLKAEDIVENIDGEQGVVVGFHEELIAIAAQGEIRGYIEADLRGWKKL